MSTTAQKRSFQSTNLNIHRQPRLPNGRLYSTSVKLKVSTSHDETLCVFHEAITRSEADRIMDVVQAEVERDGDDRRVGLRIDSAIVNPRALALIGTGLTRLERNLIFLIAHDMAVEILDRRKRQRVSKF